MRNTIIYLLKYLEYFLVSLSGAVFALFMISAYLPVALYFIIRGQTWLEKIIGVLILGGLCGLKDIFWIKKRDVPAVKIKLTQKLPEQQNKIGETEISCHWKFTELVFHSGDFVTGRWDRDRHGNIIRDNAETHDGCIMSYLTRGQNGHYAYSRINYAGLTIMQDEIIWLRFNGNRYAAVSLEFGRVLSGPFETYYPDGALRKSGFLDYGKPDGRIRTFYPQGGLKKLVNYKNGVREGNYEMLAENGEVIETGSYEDGKLSGYVLKYYDSGGQKEEIYYKRGIALTRTTFRPGGGVDKDRVSDAMALAGAKDRELRNLRRFARVREKLGKYGLEIYISQSNMFPRERGIRKAGSEYNLREFSCEEELIKAVLDREKFAEILERAKESKSGKFVVRHYNSKGKLVRER
jgi:hypothetical protein